jgi:hypothetical protein
MEYNNRFQEQASTLCTAVVSYKRGYVDGQQVNERHSDSDVQCHVMMWRTSIAFAPVRSCCIS